MVNVEKFIEYLDAIFEDVKLADLQKEMCISAININSGRLKTFNQNTKAKEAILASIALLGVFFICTSFSLV